MKVTPQCSPVMGAFWIGVTVVGKLGICHQQWLRLHPSSPDMEPQNDCEKGWDRATNHKLPSAFLLFLKCVEKEPGKCRPARGKRRSEVTQINKDP